MDEKLLLSTLLSMNKQINFLSSFCESVTQESKMINDVYGAILEIIPIMIEFSNNIGIDINLPQFYSSEEHYYCLCNSIRSCFPNLLDDNIIELFDGIIKDSSRNEANYKEKLMKKLAVVECTLDNLVSEYGYHSSVLESKIINSKYTNPEVLYNYEMFYEAINDHKTLYEQYDSLTSKLKIDLGPLIEAIEHFPINELNSLQYEFSTSINYYRKLYQEESLIRELIVLLNQYSESTNAFSILNRIKLTLMRKNIPNPSSIMILSNKLTRLFNSFREFDIMRRIYTTHEEKDLVLLISSIIPNIIHIQQIYLSLKHIIKAKKIKYDDIISKSIAIKRDILKTCPLCSRTPYACLASCGHVFCYRCTHMISNQWNNQCPRCKLVFTKNDILVINNP